MAIRFFQRISDAVQGPDPTGVRLEERWVVAKKRLLDSNPTVNEREHDRALGSVRKLFGEILNRNVDHLLELSNKVGSMELYSLLKKHSGYEHPRYGVPYGDEIDIERYSSELLLLVAIVSIHGGAIKDFGSVGDNPHFSAKVFEWLSTERQLPRAYYFKGVMAKYGPMPQSAPDIPVAEAALEKSLELGVTSAAIEIENLKIHEVLRDYEPAYYKVDSWASWSKG